MDLEQRQRRAELLQGRESRRATMTGIELRDGPDGVLTLEGTASVTGRAYDMGWYEETISPGAFTKTLSEAPDVQLLINHTDLPLARTTNGSLRLSEDPRGLRVAADLQAGDPDVQRLAPKMRRGDVTEMSFAFKATRQTWDDEYTQRSIDEVSLHRGDVSVVSYGANPFTSTSLRSMITDFSLLSDDELDEIRDDPAVLTLIRRLTPHPGFLTLDEAREVEADPQPVRLDIYQARALALRLRQVS